MHSYAANLLNYSLAVKLVRNGGDNTHHRNINWKPEFGRASLYNKSGPASHKIPGHRDPPAATLQAAHEALKTIQKTCARDKDVNKIVIITESDAFVDILARKHVT